MATVDYTTQSPSMARTLLLKARDDLSEKEIVVLHRKTDTLPKLSGFVVASQEDLGHSWCTVYKRTSA